jgi:thiosulfate/3-mercaptopyruvate sulfurtransferase
MRGYVRTVDLGDGRQVSTYAGAADDYAAGHIPNAIYLDWTRDIVDPDDPVPVQVAPPACFAAELGRRGIGDDYLIVAYDEHPAAQFATRLWWALRYYGHDRAMVLDGGLARWRREGRPLTREVPAFPPATFTPRVQPSWRATGEAVLQALGDPGVTIVDARDEAQYTGTVYRVHEGHGRAGHIPGALSLPREALIDPATGRFRPIEELRDIFTRAGIAPQERVIAYCNGGVAATTVLFGLALAGHPHLTNYDGSWNEWGVREEWPVDVPS